MHDALSHVAIVCGQKTFKFILQIHTQFEDTTKLQRAAVSRYSAEIPTTLILGGYLKHIRPDRMRLAKLLPRSLTVSAN